MKRSGWFLGLAAACLVGGQSASAASMTLQGIIDSQNTFANVGDWMQVGPNGAVETPNGPGVLGGTDFGAITSYSAPAHLPQVGSDLDRFGWAMSGTITDITGTTITYAGTGYLYAPGYGFDEVGEYLEKFTFTMTADWNGNWSGDAVVTGELFIEPGDRQPTGWPGAVDWYTGQKVILNGTFKNGGAFEATVSVVPLPAAAWAGLALLGGLGIRRKLAA